MCLLQRIAVVVENSLNLAQDLAKLQASFEQAVKSANDISHNVDVLIEALSTLGDLGIAGIANLILSKKLTKVEDVGQLLQLPKKVPTLFTDMRSVIDTLKKTTKDLQDRAPQLGEILDGSWQSESKPVKDAVAAIQTSIRNNLLQKVNAITSKANQMQDILNGLVGRGLFPQIDIKVASYRRWSDVSLNLPCSKTSRKTYNIAGFKGSFDYPEFYSCPYSQSVSFPNHHIPYIRLQLGNSNSKRSFITEPYELGNSSSLILDTSPITTFDTEHPSVSTPRHPFSTCFLVGVAMTILAFIILKSAFRDDRNARLRNEEKAW